MLRTEELEALHRFDGAEQYFTRAVDFGYSFSLDETLKKWGRDEITADFVHLIRLIRPDVLTAMQPTGTAGGLHHQASAILARDAYKFAGDVTKYPEQIEKGLRPWQAKKFYFRMGFGPPRQPAGRSTSCNLAEYDPLIGKTYAEIGTEARSMHKCQGMAALLALPGPAVSTYQITESTIAGAMDKEEKALFDGIDTSITGLAKFAAPAPRELVDGLTAIESSVQAAQKNYDSATDEATLQQLLAGLRAVRVLRGRLPTMAIDNAAQFEVDFRLEQKEREFQQAALIANGVRIEVLADDGLVVPGQPVEVAVIVANHGRAEVEVKQVTFDGFDGDAVCDLRPVAAVSRFGRGRGRRDTAPAGPVLTVLKQDQVGRCELTLTIPAKARTTEPYWHREGSAGRYTFDVDAPIGLPYRPTPFYVRVTIAIAGGEEVIDSLPVQHRYGGNIFSGEKRTELLVVPALAVRVSPDVAIIPAGSVPKAPPTARAEAAGPRASGGGRAAVVPTPAPATISREIRVTVVNGLQQAVDSEVRLEVPEDWTVAPATQSVKFSRQDESQTVRFQLTPVANAAVGEVRIRAIVSSAGKMFDRGYQVIEYPHIRRQHIYEAAATTVKVIDVKIAPNLTIGYVMGVGDQVPSALEQLGAKVEMITSDDLAWGNLSRFDVIVTGVRAYERREDLRANNSRLIDYMSNGGTVIVQYNKFEFNDAQYGPYPAQVSNNRVTDELAPVRLLEPGNPVFTTPNIIDDQAWQGWVQERGLYFLGEKDSRYRDLVELEDPFPNNKGWKRGALVEATHGKGRWIYVGLGLWRELPAGVVGAYKLLANLVSLGKPAARHVPRLR